MAGGGGTKSIGVVLTWGLHVVAILKGATKSFHPLKGGGGIDPVLRGWPQKCSDHVGFHHPLPIINDPSLSGK